MRYIYGPVHSRRLGLSLGVSLSPSKVCNFDCIYCQLGKSPNKQMLREGGADIRMIFGEIRAWLENHPHESSRLDYITFSGLGEPTLHSGLGELIRLTKGLTSIPLAVITNASLLSHREVREQISPVELIVPSLDAVEEAIFSQIDRPHGDISVSEIINGLIQLRKEYKGKIWLEIMLIKGVNDSSAHINAFKEVIGEINPDKIQLNSPVRTTAEGGIRALEEKKLKDIKKSFGLNCEII